METSKQSITESLGARPLQYRRGTNKNLLCTKKEASIHRGTNREKSADTPVLPPNYPLTLCRRGTNWEKSADTPALPPNYPLTLCLL
jgi:hypothetical protein